MESLLQFAIDLGARGVPMQMHASPINGNCGGVNFTDWPVSLFLLAAGEHSYYSTGSGWNPSLQQSLWLPEYDRPLGAPKGLAQNIAPHVYTREFEHASVWVNLTDCNATKLEWSSA